jgi:hypothetical protein
MPHGLGSDFPASANEADRPIQKFQKLAAISGGGYLTESTLTRKGQSAHSDSSDQDGDNMRKKNRIAPFIRWWRGDNDEVGSVNTAVRIHGCQIHNGKLIFLCTVRSHSKAQEQ